jgi:hypothetical protein
MQTDRQGNAPTNVTMMRAELACTQVTCLEVLNERASFEWHPPHGRHGEGRSNRRDAPFRGSPARVLHSISRPPSFNSFRGQRVRRFALPELECKPLRTLDGWRRSSRLEDEEACRDIGVLPGSPLRVAPFINGRGNGVGLVVRRHFLPLPAFPKSAPPLELLLSSTGGGTQGRSARVRAAAKSRWRR